MPMDEKRRGEIAYAAMQADIRKKLSFKDVSKSMSDRRLGNRINEPELRAIGLTLDEAAEFTDTLLRNVFEKQMKRSP